MARPLRINFEDGLYHVTSRGMRRDPIVESDAERQYWTRLLSVVATRRNWKVLAWVLMDNHYHLFVQTPAGDLSEGMHDLNSGYATVFNSRDRRKRVGSVFQGRYKAILVEKDYHYWELTRYIHLNPVRAKIVDQPDEYRWGSCRYYFHPKNAPEWLGWEEVLMKHGPDLRSARREYRRFLKDGMGEDEDSPLREAVAGTLLGSPEFVGRIVQLLRGKPVDPNVPASRALGKAVTLDQVEEAVGKVFGVRPESLRIRGRHGNEARKVAIYLARMKTGARLVEIGERFGGIRAACVSLTVKEIDRRRGEERELEEKIRGIEGDL